MDLLPTEIRVLGCLLEKQTTTPEAYPLTLNALRSACNQSTNREPVAQYDDATIRDALNRLGRRRWTRLASGPGSRAPKFRHLLDEALPMPTPARAVLTVLMLRGPQTPGELKQRADRLQPFPDLASVHAALDELIGRGLAQELVRRPGQKEERYGHRLDEETLGTEREPAPAGTPPASPPTRAATRPAMGPADDRLDALEAEVAALREELAELRESLS